MSADVDTLLAKCRNEYSTCGYDGGCNASREVTAAAIVLISVIFLIGGVIGVTRAGKKGGFE